MLAQSISSICCPSKKPAYSSFDNGCCLKTCHYAVVGLGFLNPTSQPRQANVIGKDIGESECFTLV